MPAKKKKARIGRPPSENAADVLLPQVRATEEQRKRYFEAAKQAGKSYAAWMKEILDKHS